jgi:hypothetical protein
MAADVMMGHDPDCARWIRKFREEPAVGADGEMGRGRREVGRRREYEHSAVTLRDVSPLHTTDGPAKPVPWCSGRKELRWLYSRRRAAGAGFRSAPGAAGSAFAGRRHRLGVWRARHLRPLPGHAGGGRLRQARREVARRKPVTPSGRSRRSIARPSPWPPGGACPARRRCWATWSSTCPRSSQVHRQVVRKEAEAHDIELDPVVRLHFVEVQQPDMHDPSGDLRRLEDALEFEWRLTDLKCDVLVLHRLQQALREGDWKVTVAVHGGNQIIAVWPGFREHTYGIAIDVGSTTIAAHLCNLATGEVVAASGIMNPQIRFRRRPDEPGLLRDDEPGRREGDDQAVRGAINQLAADVAFQVGIEPTDILEATFVGNPIMHHLLLGISPIELGGAPFALATDRAITLWAVEIDFAHPPQCAHLCVAVHCRPCGRRHRRRGAGRAARPDRRGDAAGRRRHQCRDRAGQQRRLLACSSPTGPAFEGAQISCGQRAAPGAIERVRIDGVTLEPRFKVIGCDLWSDEPGLCRRDRRDRRDRHLRLGHHRDPGRAVPGRRDPPRRRDQRRTGRAQPAHPERRAAPSPTRSVPATVGVARRSRSPRTTCAPSSSARRRCMPACAC